MSIWQIILWPFLLVPWQVWIGVAAVICMCGVIVLFVLSIVLVMDKHEEWTTKLLAIPMLYLMVILILASVSLWKLTGLK